MDPLALALALAQEADEVLEALASLSAATSMAASSLALLLLGSASRSLFELMSGGWSKEG